MAKAQGDVVWQDLDVETMPKDIRDAYEVYKEAQREAAKLRAEFEAKMNDHAKPALPQGHKLVFGYRFGKLSAAIVEDDKPKATNGKGKQSLSQYLAGMQSAGLRA